MIYKIILITLVFIPTTWAEGDAQGFQDLLYSCQDAQVEMAAVASEKEAELKNAAYPVEKITSSNLILYQKENYEEYQRVKRTGSRTLTRQCGDFTVMIRGGFFNANPMGELGAVEFPIVSLSFKGKPLVKEMGIGVCMKNHIISRYNRMPCPDNWATVIIGFKEGKLYLKHDYEKFTKNGEYSEDSYEEYRPQP